MAQYNWGTCPAPVREQVRRLVEALPATLGDNLIGLYLHGSLALGCFNPLRSDLDLLAVTRDGLAVESKRVLAEMLLAVSRQPSPVEISLLRQADLVPWRYPTSYDFHFSEAWRTAFVDALSGDAWRAWNDKQNYDADLAAHITVTRERGLALIGPAMAEVLPIVPKQDFVASILSDVLSPRFGLTGEPGHLAYAVLNVCRTLAYLRTGTVLSKAEGGAWALHALPNRFEGLIAAALAAYGDDAGDGGCSVDLVADLAEYVRTEIERLK